MKLRVKALANLRHYLPEKQEYIEVEVADGQSVSEIIDLLKIPGPEVMMVIKNKQKIPLDHVPGDNDLIELYPVLAGG